MIGTTHWLRTRLPKQPARSTGIPTTPACRAACTFHEPKFFTENLDFCLAHPSPTLVLIFRFFAEEFAKQLTTLVHCFR
jgi:hypothetical protein